MLQLFPVVEAPFQRRDFWWPLPVPWPSYPHFIELSGDCSTEGVELVLCQFAAYNGNENTLTPEQLLDHDDKFLLPGGLLARSGVLEIAPSCCCGLESWPEWRRVVDGESPWMGHDPGPWVEKVDDIFHLWPDGDAQGRQRIGEAIAFDATTLAAQLDRVTVSLQGFRRRLSEVIAAHLPDKADALAALFDREFGGEQSE